MLSRTAGRQAGFSLVEIMVAMALSLVLFGGLLNAYVATVKSSGELISAAHLDNELHKLMDMMSRDVRRAGTHGDPVALISSGGTNPFALGTPSAHSGEAANSCLTFSYDWDSDGVLDTASPDERYGYRLKNGAVQARQGGLGCNANAEPHWFDITDPDVYTITALQFDVTSQTVSGMIMRDVEITLNAQLVSDAEVTRNLIKTVRVRNDIPTP